MLKAKYGWGPQIWSFLHTVSIFCDQKVSQKDFNKIKNILMNVQNIIPCTPCEKEYALFAPTLNQISYKDFLNDRMVLFKWTYLVHNHVNKKIKKPTITYKQALQQWTIS